jgi:hypothetical protein
MLSKLSEGQRRTFWDPLCFPHSLVDNLVPVGLDLALGHILESILTIHQIIVVSLRVGATGPEPRGERE